MPPLNRGQTILQLIVEAYIQHAQPVSSQALCSQQPQLGMAPATLRKAFAELEEQGLLAQPHASSGRVPTEAGMRRYLEQLASPRLRPWDRSRLEQIVEQPADVGRFGARLGRALAELSGHLVLVAQPRFLGEKLREVGLMRCDSRRLLATFVSPNGSVQQQLVEMDVCLSSAELQAIANYLNAHLQDRTLPEVRRTLDAELAASASHHDRLVAQAYEIGRRLVPEAPPDAGGMDIFVEGESKLLDHPEFADLPKLRRLLHALAEKHTLLSLVARVLDRSGVQVVLSSDDPLADRHNLAFVACAYRGTAGRGGAVTVIGPPRMDYSRLVPLVQHAGRIYGRFWETL